MSKTPPTSTPALGNGPLTLSGTLMMQDCYLLSFLCIVDADWISDDFLDILSRDRASGSIFGTQRYTAILRRLLKQNLIQRRKNTVFQYYHVPLALRECVLHYILAFEQHRDMKSFVNAGCETILSALTAAKSRQGSHYRKSLEHVYPHIQSICLTARNNKCVLSDRFLEAFHEMCLVALQKATQSAESFFYKQFWRT